ncbi:antibiotic biosynthesis monooxygenase family protein [Hyphococcus sp.]|jgi:heme-degrading monooxygenase HmoA|uniref:antibiotic biosynthesis monooxygenase family protein n=1 Tax=Hyphococcus sp. TaxID=2038636 RepID=UPI003D0E8C6D
MISSRAPQPPYYAVIFSSRRTPGDNGYADMAEQMDELAKTMPGYLGIESARGEDGLGITVSYWESEAAIANWKKNAAHLEAQRKGRAEWYDDYTVRVAKVERAYEMKK